MGKAFSLTWRPFILNSLGVAVLGSAAFMVAAASLVSPASASPASPAASLEGPLQDGARRGSLETAPFSFPEAPSAPSEGALDENKEEKGASKAVFTFGMKLGGGISLWGAPDDVPKDSEGRALVPIFDATRVGPLGSAGLFAQGVFWENFGIEIGFHMVRHHLIEYIGWAYQETIIGTRETRTETRNALSESSLSFTALHIPILVKAVFPTKSTRVSLGIGPEFAIGSWSEGQFKIKRSDEPEGPNGERYLPGDRRGFKSIRAKNMNSIYLTVQFGVEVLFGRVTMPIEAYWSYNFSQPSRYLERAEMTNDGGPLPEAPTWVSLKARDSMYGGIRVGLAYQF